MFLTVICIVVAVIAALVVAYVLFTIVRTTIYYRKILNKKHYAEVVNWLHGVLKLGAIGEPRYEDHTAYITSGKCALTLTRQISDKDTIHIAMSQTTRPTDCGVCHRFAFLMLEDLKSNNATSDFYHTDGKIHHLLLSKEVGGEWITGDTKAVVSQILFYEYESLSCRFEPDLSAP